MHYWHRCNSKHSGKCSHLPPFARRNEQVIGKNRLLQELRNTKASLHASSLQRNISEYPWVTLNLPMVLENACKVDGYRIPNRQGTRVCETTIWSSNLTGF
ncbi:hypothetical protein L484_003442 [Morus notabilis]|uniref:Uncharacterized protein n=1 Tax=Morus notabilis TaxID=981085 RepID=W9R4E8_9ROSA|nr:hypothetical protein L484_003442 [Morus notabilis]